MTRKKLEGKKPKLIPVATYVKNVETLRNTPYRIYPDGSHGYLVDGVLIDKKEYEARFPVPESLVINNTENSDGTKNWLK